MRLFVTINYYTLVSPQLFHFLVIEKALSNNNLLPSPSLITIFLYQNFIEVTNWLRCRLLWLIKYLSEIYTFYGVLGYIFQLIRTTLITRNYVISIFLYLLLVGKKQNGHQPQSEVLAWFPGKKFPAEKMLSNIILLSRLFLVSILARYCCRESSWY